MTAKIPQPTVERLCKVYQVCTDLEGRGIDTVSSGELAAILGVSALVVRKDISRVGDVSSAGMRYRVERLRQQLSSRLGLGSEHRACVVGLGRLGTALLEHRQLAVSGFRIVAGFDTNTNRVEATRTEVPLYMASEIREVIRREAIEVGIVAVPAAAAQRCADALAEGGVTSILNFAPVALEVQAPGAVVRNVDFANELRVLVALRNVDQRGALSSDSEDNQKGEAA